MRSGQLRHLVDIQEVTKVRDSSGGYTESWTRLRNAWCSISPIRGREFFENQSVSSDITHKVIMRAQVDVTPRDRIVHGDRVFHVEHVANVSERGIKLEILVRESV